MQLHSELEDLERQLMDIATSYLSKDAIRLAYDIEDTIDSNAQAKSCGCLSRLYSERSLQADLEIFRGKIKELGRLIGENNDDTAGGISLSSGGGITFDAATRRSLSAGSEVIVAMEYERNVLFHHLLSPGYSVIAIHGAGGSGKTTLARWAYNHDFVKEHFHLRVWVNVGKDLRPREILEQMLFSVGVSQEWQSIPKMETTELMEKLYKVLKGRICLVVLDDVWSLDAWSTINPVLPQDDNGSRVIITTRSEDSVPPSSYVHRKNYLSRYESWMLMALILQLPDGHGVEAAEVRKIGKQIVDHCGGIPLSVIVASNLLKGKKLDDWKVVLQYLDQRRNPDGGIGNILGLSYDTLPTPLKPCFIYLGHYPSNHDILVDRLYLLWMAEGLISTKGAPNLSKFDVTENYLKELVDRRMVMVQDEEEWSTQRPKSCRIHDLLRDLCMKKGKEEEFFRVVGSVRVKGTSFTSRRLAIYLNTQENKDRVSLEIPEAKTVRSLLLFKTQKNSKWEIVDLKEFRYLRVLDFDRINFRVQKLPKNMDKLVYLRYLSFRGCYITEFPSSFSNFPFLETLDLWVIETCRMTIPNVLRKLTSLRHLYLPVLFQIGKSTKDDKLRLDGLTRLEILENFDASLCDVDDLWQLQKIHVFSGVVDGNNEDLEKIINFLNENVRSSRQTSLLVKRFDCYSERRFSILKILLHCHALHSLEIEGFLGELQRLEGIGSTSNFTKMVFSGSEFGQDPMQILGKLPNLRSLVLCNDAFAGKTMECSEADFPALTSLKLAMLQSLQTWEVKLEAMPNLTFLTIEQCGELQTLPVELMKKWTLKEIKIGSMPQKFQENVRQMDIYNFARITPYDC
ncbi:probable disease resistance RPP8-like protein 2 isoform X2 [Henckelia pumila]